MKIVIRAGGIGTRLWPMSRKNNPKQFQSIQGNKTMVKRTFERIEPLLASSDDLYVSVHQKFVDKVKNEIDSVKNENICIPFIICLNYPPLKK